MKTAASNFCQTLDAFNPAMLEDKDTGFCEKNISNQFAYAFLTGRKEWDPKAYFEVPFLQNAKSIDHHVDAYVFDNEVGLFIESKRLYQLQKLREIKDDIERLDKRTINWILSNMLVPPKKCPQSVYVLVLADTWEKDIKEWWETGEFKIGRRKWDREFIKGYICNSVHIKHFRDWEPPKNDLYWLSAIKEIKVDR